MKFMFGIQHPLTCKSWTTLSNPCNKVRGKYVVKEVFVRLPSCVFLPALSFMHLSLLLCRCDAAWTCKWLYNNCHSWWISKMQSDTLEERYAIRFCFKLGKIPQKHMEFFRLLFDNLAWIKHRFLSGIRDSRKAGSLWGMMRGVWGVRKSIHQSYLAKRLGLGLLCWGFKGNQKEIPSEEVSTLQIGSVAFSSVQCTSPQLHPSHRLFEQDGYQDSSSPSL